MSQQPAAPHRADHEEPVVCRRCLTRPGCPGQHIGACFQSFRVRDVRPARLVVVAEVGPSVVWPNRNLFSGRSWWCRGWQRCSFAMEFEDTCTVQLLPSLEWFPVHLESLRLCRALCFRDSADGAVACETPVVAARLVRRPAPARLASCRADHDASRSVPRHVSLLLPRPGLCKVDGHVPG